MEGFDGHPGTGRLAKVLCDRIKRENAHPLDLDFGEIMANGSLLTNTYPVPIPKGEYSVCRQLTLGETGEKLTKTKKDGQHPHPGVGQGGSGKRREKREREREKDQGCLYLWMLM